MRHCALKAETRVTKTVPRELRFKLLNQTGILIIEGDILCSYTHTTLYNFSHDVNIEGQLFMIDNEIIV